MKHLSSLLLILFACCVTGKEIQYIGSTPANSSVVRTFLGIPATDSIDFIRWKIILQDDKYELKCNYGIGKPSTPGFMEGGKWVELKGNLRKENNYYYLQSGDKTLVMLQVNNSLLHLLNDDKTLLIGNGGWSYTLNREKGAASDEINISIKPVTLKDSVSFHGRTPCWDFALVHSSPQCYKKKWSIILYTDPRTHEPTTYNLNRSRISEGTWGKWKVATGKDGRIIYQLYSEKEKDPLELLVLDENVVAFIDKQGKILVGNEDFSYTLSKRW
jgi:hypothetical protein